MAASFLNCLKYHTFQSQNKKAFLKLICYMCTIFVYCYQRSYIAERKHTADIFALLRLASM